MMTIRLLPNDLWNTCLPTTTTHPAGFYEFHAFKHWTRYWFEHRTLFDFIELNNETSRAVPSGGD